MAAEELRKSRDSHPQYDQEAIACLKRLQEENQQLHPYANHKLVEKRANKARNRPMSHRMRQVLEKMNVTANAEADKVISAAQKRPSARGKCTNVAEYMAAARRAEFEKLR